ncbi:MAG: 50S ribosomal protein L29 [Armatimonadota bacterium]|nr:50S ribosomal protein L29 [Armatimonadota bacterium]
MRLTEKRRQIKDSNERELEQVIKEERKALFSLRHEMSAKQLANPKRIKEARKNIARALTVMREREIAKEKGQA